MENSNIQWTEHTWNPWVGCAPIGAGCLHCYAQGWAKRTGNAELWEHKRRKTSETNWKSPRKFDRKAGALGIRQRLFVGSLCDIFENGGDHDFADWMDDTRADAFDILEDLENLDVLLLTKRPAYAVQWLHRRYGELDIPLHFRLGCSISNQSEADRWIPELVMYSGLTFLSVEPMLGPIDLTFKCQSCECPKSLGHGFEAIEGLGWVICGGESGGKARPIHPDWIRTLRDQCHHAGVPFMFKQHGEWIHSTQITWPVAGILPEVRGWRLSRLDGRIKGTEPVNGERFYRLGKKNTGHLLDGREHMEVPV